MIRTSTPQRANLFSRTALGLALALGAVAGGVLLSTPALAAKEKGGAPKLSLSKGFTAVAAPAQKTIDGLGEGDAAAGAQAKAELEQVFGAIESEDDRFMAGSLAVNLGGKLKDPALQRRGLEAMLQSGKVEQQNIGRFNFFVGQIAYQQKDYATAIAALQKAISAGFRDNDADALLAEAYFANNQAAQGLTVLQQAIAQKASSGSAAPAGWYRRGLGAAYKANMPDKAAEFGAGLVRNHPTAENWAGAITVLREVGKFGSQETLDLMRLMGRTNSYAEERDYVEYIQAADPRRLPGEVVKIIDAGVSSGKLKTSDTFVSDARAQASGRVAQDKASLASYERDARAASATEATITGAADALLSYGEAAKAEELYQIALGKPGVDTQRVLTRLGIAQADQGKFDAAQQTFAKVTGPRKPIAMLWSAYAAGKAVPATAASPAS